MVNAFTQLNRGIDGGAFNEPGILLPLSGKAQSAVGYEIWVHYSCAFLPYAAFCISSRETTEMRTKGCTLIAVPKRNSLAFTCFSRAREQDDCLYSWCFHFVRGDVIRRLKPHWLSRITAEWLRRALRENCAFCALRRVRKPCCDSFLCERASTMFSQRRIRRRSK